MNRMFRFGGRERRNGRGAAQVWSADSSIGHRVCARVARVKRVIVFVLLFVACARRDAVPASSEQEPEPIACVNEWTRVASGIEYRTLNCTSSRFDLHLVRVDPRVAQIDALERPGSTATDLGRDYTFALNANFFDEQFRPLGVIVSSGKQVNPLHPVSWQSVFYVDRDGTPGIVPMKQWPDVSETATAAAQCGPRLVIDGEVNEVVRAEPTWRSGVCIDAEKRVIFFATPPDTELDVHETRTLAHKDLACRDAMLFDGGPSVQMFLKRAEGAVEVEGDKRVPGYVVVR